MFVSVLVSSRRRISEVLLRLARLLLNSFDTGWNVVALGGFAAWNSVKTFSWIWPLYVALSALDPADNGFAMFGASDDVLISFSPVWVKI